MSVFIDAGRMASFDSVRLSVFCRTAIDVFALHKCSGSSHLRVIWSPKCLFRGPAGPTAHVRWLFRRRGWRKAEPNSASNAIFIGSSRPETAVWCVTAGDDEVQ